MIEKSGIAAIGGAILLMALAAARGEDAPRFPQPIMEQLNPEQQAVAAEVLKQSSAGLGGPYGMLIKSPELLKRYLLMTDYLRQKTSLPHRLNEMAILLEARLWDAQYEWWAHEPLARKAGLSDAIIDDIRAGKRPDAMQPDEAIVYDVVTELLNKRQLSDDTFAQGQTNPRRAAGRRSGRGHRLLCHGLGGGHRRADRDTEWRPGADAGTGQVTSETVHALTSSRAYCSA